MPLCVGNVLFGNGFQLLISLAAMYNEINSVRIEITILLNCFKILANAALKIGIP